RPAKAVEYANRMFQRNNLFCGGSQVRSFIDREGELCLCVFGMNQECRAPVDISPQHPEAFISGVPGFNDDVVEFIPQEVFHHPLITWLNFQKIRQHSDRCESALHHSRLKELAYRFGGVTMLGDDCFERSLFTRCRSIFRSKDVEI